MRTKKIKEDFQKAFQNRKDLTVVFKIKVDNLKQIVQRKMKQNTNFLREINEYKRTKVQTLQLQVNDSVEN